MAQSEVDRDAERALASAETQAAVEAAEAADPSDGSTVRAEHVDLRQGGASRIDATTVTLTQGGASRINAHDVSITMGGAALVRTDTLRAEQGSSVMAVLSRRAHLASGSRVVVLITRHSSGDARPLIDWRSALAAVIGFALLRRLLRR